MAIMAALALAGIGLNLARQSQQAQEANLQSRLHQKDLKQQARISQAMFDLQFPNLVQQQRANRGQMATHAAKGVAAESVSTLALISEQARIDSINQSLAKFQQSLDQQGFKFGISQSKRDVKFTKMNLLLQGLSGGIQGANVVFGPPPVE